VAAAGGDAVLDAAEAYRRLPAVAPRLWGASTAHADAPLPADLEDDLHTHLRRVGGASHLPDASARRLEDWARASLRGDTRWRVRVSRAALRPWVRALLRGRWPDVPVLADGEQRTA
jgi:hypothetical protein